MVTSQSLIMHPVTFDPGFKLNFVLAVLCILRSKLGVARVGWRVRPAQVRQWETPRCQKPIPVPIASKSLHALM